MSSKAQRLRSTNGRSRDLTPRERDIVPWLIAGKSDWEMGEILNLSHKTVNFHVENMKRKYDVRSRAQFVAAYIDRQNSHP